MANKKTQTLFNFNSQELKGKKFAKLITNSQDQPNNYDLTHLLAENNLLQSNDTKEVICYQKNDIPFPALLYLNKKKINERWLLCVTINNFTEKTKIQENMLWSSTHDPLTKLPNRQLLQTKLQDAIQQTVIEQNHIALIFIDLDNFKLVNDTYGHEMGDRLLKIIEVF